MVTDSIPVQDFLDFLMLYHDKPRPENATINDNGVLRTFGTNSGTEGLFCEALKNSGLCSGDMYVVRQVYYRIIMGKIGRPLRKFDNTWQLFNAILGAIKCHRDAVEHAKVLHRDISDGNVLMDKDGNGLLIDWDLCVYMDETAETEARRRERTGTRQYMAIRIMQNTGCRHEPRDDMESFVYMSWYHALRYRVIPTDIDAFKKELEHTFGGFVPGGKVSLLGLSAAFTNPTKGLPPASRLLLRDLCELFEPLYKEEPASADDSYATPSTVEEIQRYHDKWKDAYDRATKLVETHDSIIAILEKRLYYRELEWVSYDAACDVYRPGVRPILPPLVVVPKKVGHLPGPSHTSHRTRSTATAGKREASDVDEANEVDDGDSGSSPSPRASKRSRRDDGSAAYLGNARSAPSREGGPGPSNPPRRRKA